MHTIYYVDQCLLIKTRNEHSLELEVMPPHMILMQHHIDFA